jgi:hypothetical protein
MRLVVVVVVVVVAQTVNDSTSDTSCTCAGDGNVQHRLWLTLKGAQ